MVLDLLDQLQIFWQLCLIELLGLASGQATRALALDIFKTFSKRWMLEFFPNLSLMKFQVRCLTLFRSFSVIAWGGCVWMGNLHKNIQLMLEFLKGSSLALPVSYYTLMTFVMSLSVIFDIYPDDTTHCSKCHKASDLWQQLELVSKLEPDLQGCVDWGRKWLVDFNAVKLN